MTLILASRSASRQAILRAAAVPYEVILPDADEDAAKALFRTANQDPAALALHLAEFKALALTESHPGALILGSDQTLALDDGTMLDKAKDKDDLAGQLAHMAGRTHELISAAVLVRSGQVIWQHVERVRMSVRPLSAAFIADYIEREWDEVRWCVGGYQIEGRGAQLFERIEGNHFAIMGLPLLPLLQALRAEGILTS
ncbi:Maf family protein [Aquisediminimonas sediminicola]|uniref:Maf family protein n=1 Tax=Alteraquisediminimonas sediminicola TaxID=2676787 RepID=UPI001C8D4C39|nr:nucleoside triphosphate pyrophosphatase [Aquisediminimonas sediminicola]